APEPKRLLPEQHLDHGFAGRAEIERVRRDQVAAVSDDLVGILHDLELFVAVMAMQPHAFADDLKNVDDAERRSRLMRAKLAVIGMVDRNQRVDAGIARSL